VSQPRISLSFPSTRDCKNSKDTRPGFAVIREHALLTIRNLMVNNPENQAVVGTMDPIGIVGPNGELMEMPKKAS
jgi:hypothetical protein